MPLILPVRFAVRRRGDLVNRQIGAVEFLLAIEPVLDSIVVTRLPPDATALAAQRGYLPAHVPLLKRVGAVAPQEVCIAGGSVRIDGVPSAVVLPADRWGRPLASWQQCRRLEPGELFLLSVTNPSSFDSRYFGPVSASAVIGVAHPVWLETARDGR